MPGGGQESIMRVISILKINDHYYAEHELDPVPGGRGQLDDVICVCCVCGIRD